MHNFQERKFNKINQKYGDLLNYHKHLPPFSPLMSLHALLKTLMQTLNLRLYCCLLTEYSIPVMQVCSVLVV